MLLKCKPNKLDAVLIICSSTQLRSSHNYTNTDQFVQKAGHDNMTAAHATLAVNVLFLCPGGHAIVNIPHLGLHHYLVHIQGQAIVSHPICMKDSW